MATSSKILHSFLADALKANKRYEQVRFEDLIEYNRAVCRQNDFLSSLNFYLELLDNTDKIMFAYMNEEQKEKQRYHLRLTILLLRAQQQHEIDYQKTENIKSYDDKIKRCNELLVALNPKSPKTVSLELEQHEISECKPVKYLGMSLGHQLGQQISKWMEGSSKSLKQYMGDLNEKRLYWVWGSSFIKTIIDLIPDDFFSIQKAAEGIKTPDFYAGNLSWTLYYFRFSLHLFLLLKHTIKGPWMSEEEAKTPWHERFQTQWSQRKFNLLNDSLWGTANLVTFFWLTGKGTLGALGDAVTVVLLVFDISVAIWDFEEQKTQYNKQMMEYETEIQRLKEEINKLRTLHFEDEKDKKANKLKIQQLRMQMDDLDLEKIKCKTNWEIQKLSLVNNLAYAVGLMLAFFVLTMPFIPISAPVAVVVGAVLCFALTVINNAIKGGLELYQTHQSIKAIDVKEHKAELKLRKKLLKNNTDLNDNQKKLLYLEIQQLKAESDYQRQMYQYQAAGLVRTVMLQVFTPAIISSSLLLLPMLLTSVALPPVALFVIGAGVVMGLAVLSHAFINLAFKPKEKKELEFDEKNYEKYCISLMQKTEKERENCFFKDQSRDSHYTKLKNDRVSARSDGLLASSSI